MQQTAALGVNMKVTSYPCKKNVSRFQLSVHADKIYDTKYTLNFTDTNNFKL
jgi:hypothetical protein